MRRPTPETVQRKPEQEHRPGDAKGFRRDQKLGHGDQDDDDRDSRLVTDGDR